jgi:ribosomal protein L24E
MTFKSNTQPFCRYCGGPIRKKTATVFIRAPGKGTGLSNYGSRLIEVEPLPQTKEDCQKYTNQKIMSVKRDKRMNYDINKMEDFGIDQFTEWDGETYDDKFFCSGTCAQKMAYGILEKQPTWGTEAYRKARDAEVGPSAEA